MAEPQQDPPQQPQQDPPPQDPPQQPQQDPPKQPKKRLKFSVSEKDEDYKNNRFCLAIGKAVSDDDEKKGIYYAPKIMEIEEQLVLNTRERLKRAEAGQKELGEIVSRYTERGTEIGKKKDEKMKEIRKMAAEQKDLIVKWEESVLSELEKEYQKISDEYGSIINKSNDLNEVISGKVESLKKVLGMLEKRDINGDEGVEQIHKFSIELEEKIKAIEEIKEKSCVDYQFNFTSKNVFDEVFDFSDTKGTLMATKDLGKEYIEAQPEGQKGDHEELIYAPDDKFSIKCEEEGHDMYERYLLHEGEKKWYCFMCEKADAKHYKKIVEEKKTKLDEICREVEENCNKISARNEKNTENEKANIEGLNAKKKDIDTFFEEEHKKLDAKRTEILAKLESDFKTAFEEIRKEHERLRLYLKEGNHLLALARKTARDYEWAMDKTKVSYKPIQQLILDVEHLGDKKNIFTGKVPTLEDESKKKFMKIDFNHPDEQKITEGINTISVNVAVVPEQ